MGKAHRDLLRPDMKKGPAPGADSTFRQENDLNPPKKSTATSKKVGNLSSSKAGKGGPDGSWK